MTPPERITSLFLLLIRCQRGQLDICIIATQMGCLAIFRYPQLLKTKKRQPSLVHMAPMLIGECHSGYVMHRLLSSGVCWLYLMIWSRKSWKSSWMTSWSLVIVSWIIYQIQRGFSFVVRRQILYLIRKNVTSCVRKALYLVIRSLTKALKLTRQKQM